MPIEDTTEFVGLDIVIELEFYFKYHYGLSYNTIPTAKLYA